MRPQALYTERTVNGKVYISFQGVKDSDLRAKVGPFTQANLAKLAYAQPQLFAVFCLYQGWILASKDEEGFAPLEEVECIAQDTAKRLLSAKISVSQVSGPDRVSSAHHP